MDTSWINTSDTTHRYNMLSRFQMDCEYFLGNGGRNEKHLWAGNVEDHVEIMKLTWYSFEEDEKPEWLTWENILDYEGAMIG